MASAEDSGGSSAPANIPWITIPWCPSERNPSCSISPHSFAQVTIRLVHNSEQSTAKGDCHWCKTSHFKHPRREWPSTREGCAHARAGCFVRRSHKNRDACRRAWYRQNPTCPEAFSLRCLQEGQGVLGQVHKNRRNAALLALGTDSQRVFQG
jgi:hypothetical protein